MTLKVLIIKKVIIIVVIKDKIKFDKLFKFQKVEKLFKFQKIKWFKFLIINARKIYIKLRKIFIQTTIF